MYITWLKLFKLPTVVASIMVVTVLTCCTLLPTMYDWKATQINVRHSLTQELRLYKFILGCDAAKTFVVSKIKVKLITVL